MDAGFVLALPFHHGDLGPDCVGVSRRGEGGGNSHQRFPQNMGNMKLD